MLLYSVFFYDLSSICGNWVQMWPLAMVSPPPTQPMPCILRLYAQSCYKLHSEHTQFTKENETEFLRIERGLKIEFFTGWVKYRYVLTVKENHIKVGMLGIFFSFLTLKKFGLVSYVEFVLVRLKNEF